MHSSIQQVFIAFLLCAEFCAEYWGFLGAVPPSRSTQPSRGDTYPMSHSASCGLAVNCVSGAGVPCSENLGMGQGRLPEGSDIWSEL